MCTARLVLAPLFCVYHSIACKAVCLSVYEKYTYLALCITVTCTRTSISTAVKRQRLPMLISRINKRLQ
jgi:hypothetical protein